MTEVLATWDQAASEWAGKIAKDGSFRTHLMLPALERLFAGSSGQSVLDAGCGNGYLTGWLAKKGFEAQGFDGSEQMIQAARQSYPELQFKVADALKPLDFKNQEFDAILASMLLMHLPDTKTFLSECARLLKAKGRLIVSVLHPCFNLPTAKLYKSPWDKLTFRKPSALSFNYFEAGEGRNEAHLGKRLTHYHRTLEQYAQDFAKAGFAVATILEPHHLPDEFLAVHPKTEYATRLPRFIFFECIKLD